MFLYAGINWVSPSFRGDSIKISVEILVEFSRDGAHLGYDPVTFLPFQLCHIQHFLEGAH